MQEANNIIYKSKKEFEELPEEIKSNFRNHVEFLKFIDNPANAEKMLKLGILTPRQVDTLTMNETQEATPTQTPTQEKDKAK